MVIFKPHDTAAPPAASPALLFQLDVLEYIHENEYVHADIKAANLMLGYKDPEQVCSTKTFNSTVFHYQICFIYYFCVELQSNQLSILYKRFNEFFVKQVYLADYGLSYRYSPEGVHRPYKENPKKSHNGTIEYTSLDAHKGLGEEPVCRTSWRNQL